MSLTRRYHLGFIKAGEAAERLILRFENLIARVETLSNAIDFLPLYVKKKQKDNQSVTKHDPFLN